MGEGAQGSQSWGYASAAAMLLLALLFPIALMVFNPTLMFERGWEQYVGTAIYFWAVLTLGRELHWLWKNEHAFRDAPNLLKLISGGTVTGQAGSAAARKIDSEERRILPARIRQLACTING